MPVRLNPRVFLSPDDLSGGSGTISTAPDTENPPAEPKTFTQEDLDAKVEKRLAQEKKKQQKELQANQQKISDLENQLKQLQELVEKNHKEDDPPRDLQGQVELLTKKHQREVEALQQKLQEISNTATKEKQLRELTERDKLVQEALQKVHCTDIVCGKRYVLEQVVMDPEDGWVYLTKSGNTVSIEDGVAEELPPYLRPSEMRGGGSGALNGSPARITEKKKALEVEEKKLADLERQARTRPNVNTIITAFKRQKEIVTKLKQELAAK